MANVKKELRVSDTDIKRLNHLGLGLRAIADHLGCHPATITLRLKAMHLDPTDTRRSFMEQVFSGLSRDEQDWISHNLFNQGITVKTFVTQVIKEGFANASKDSAAAPAPVPEMVSGTRRSLEEIKAAVTAGSTPEAGSPSSEPHTVSEGTPAPAPAKLNFT